MKTAKEMYDYCVYNGFDEGKNQKYIKSFELIIEKYLDYDEKVLLPLTLFDVLEDEKMVMSGSYTVAVFTTLKRIICCNIGLFSKKERVKIIKLSATNDIQLTRGGMFKNSIDRITIDTIRDKIGLQNTSKSIEAMFPHVLKTFSSYNWEEKQSTTSFEGNISSIIKEIEGLKYLLDNSLITIEEFETKKKQLLNFE